MLKWTKWNWDIILYIKNGTSILIFLYFFCILYSLQMKVEHRVVFSILFSIKSTKWNGNKVKRSGIGTQSSSFFGWWKNWIKTKLKQVKWNTGLPFPAYYQRLIRPIYLGNETQLKWMQLEHSIHSTLPPISTTNSNSKWICNNWNWNTVLVLPINGKTYCLCRAHIA